MVEVMKHFNEESLLFIFLMVVVTPMAFLLMPAFAVLVIIGAIVTLIVSLRKHHGTPS